MRLFLALGLFLLATAPALAADPAPFIHPVFEEDGAFGYCLGEQTYADGRKLTIAFSPQEEINLGATLPNAGFQAGSHYDLILQLDSSPTRQIRARAINTETILLQMGGTKNFQGAFQAARSLALGASGHMSHFDLPDMRAFFQTLKACNAEHEGQNAPQTTAPAPKTTAPAPRATAAPASLPPALEDLLKAAGLGPVTALSMADIPEDKRPADFLWQMGKILGGVRERQVPKDKTLSELIGLHMQGLKRKCSGAFKAVIEREQTAPMLHLRTAEASCTPAKDTKGKPVVVGLVFSLTDEGILTVLTHEGFGDYKTQILGARDNLAKTMIRDMESQGLKKN